MERLPLIDVPSEDDRASSSSSCDVSVHQSTSGGHRSLLMVLSLLLFFPKCGPTRLGILKIECGRSQEKMSKQMEQALQLVEASEQKQSMTSKHYLRNSLDWDRDFLTSEGVLNNEELAIINSTFKKSEACSLPIITEDAKKTAELNSYLDNDLTLVRNSVDRNLKSPSDITRMRSTTSATNRSSSGLITNIASMRTSRTKTVGRSASNSTISSSSAVKLTSSTPSSSFDSAASGSFSSTHFAVKSAINSIEASSPSLSFESAGNGKVHSAGCSSCLRSEDHGDQSSKLHATKNTPDDEVTSKPSRGDHPRSSTNNNSATKCCRSPVKKPLTTQTSKQPSFLKATTGASKTDSTNKLKRDTIQHTTPATRNRALNSGSSQTRSTALIRNRKHISQSLEQLPKLAE
ncbi:hypothetical protein MUK42_28704 [Musa troglodytarum]|uniref:Uncharacterized protein n=1 Tax=Musa troglodytarum TaxID=320322 RepID=A0A9E7EYI0_9LILI|nr:hypothetical protein MUK42_28704 [Musa troglodytarum]